MMVAMGKRILDMTPAEFEDTFDRIFGPDLLGVVCPFCGAGDGDFCETPKGRVTIHEARRKAARQALDNKRANAGVTGGSTPNPPSAAGENADSATPDNRRLDGG